MITFKKTYFFLTILIFSIEVAIALYVKDKFIRPYVGDILVVILLYCFLKTFLKLPVMTAAVAVLCFAFTVEFLQYLDIVDVLGLEKSRVARTIIGATFSWMDMLCYIVGIGIVLLTEKYFLEKGMKTIA